VAERSQSATFVVGNIKKNPKQSTRLGLPLSCCLDQASEQGDRNCRGLVAALPAYWALAAAPSASFSCAIGSPNSAISRSPSFLTTLSPNSRSPRPRSLPASDRPTLWDRVRQQRLLSRLPRLGEQSAPVAIRRSDEASRHVVAEKRDGGGVAAVGHRARAAGLGGILGVGERRLRAEGVRTERESSILEPATWVNASQAPAAELRADVLDPPATAAE
jgi:hypothetical protein